MHLKRDARRQGDKLLAEVFDLTVSCQKQVSGLSCHKSRKSSKVRRKFGRLTQIKMPKSSVGMVCLRCHTMT